MRRESPALIIFILFAVSTFAWIDRSVVPLLIDPIKASLGLTDVQVSILMGFAFSLTYSLMNIPAGILADRASRRGILGASSAIWSVLLMACGAVSGYWQLLAARVGIGAAEAFVAPASFSLIGERVPPERHGWAFAVMGMGPFLGGALGLVGGGAVLAMAQKGGFSGLPFLSVLEPWQTVFVLSGVITLPLIGLVLLLRPDPRPAALGATEGFLGLGGAGRLLRAHAWVYGLLIVYSVFTALLIFGISTWIPAMMARKFGISLEEIGYIYGMQGLVFGIAGLLVGGALIDAMTRRGRDIVALAALLITLLSFAYVAVPLVTDAFYAWTLIAFGAIVAGPLYPIGSTVLARVTPPEMMGKMSVAFFLPQGVIGAALGPTLIAMIAEGWFTGPTAIAPAMALFAVLTGVGSLIFALALMRALRLHAARASGAEG
jgi:MFS family permease